MNSRIKACRSESPWPLVLLGLGWLVILGLAEWSYRGPALVTTDTADRFCGRRAEEFLERLVGNNLPHPVGSEDHLRMRAEVIALAEQLGYAVEQQVTRFRFAESGREIPLTNILFRLKGTDPSSRSVLVAAHYDSADQAPGAGDDAAGVAVLLEIARRLRLDPPRNDVLFLITDGEEKGLLGARCFCAEHPAANTLGACINLEARGTSGPSLLFQTGEPNGWLVAQMGRHLSRPRTSSLFFEIYKRMPNDTDFTVFQRAGINGFNLAFIGDYRNYHTPGDNLANLSRASLQHHGDNAWELVQSLGAENLDEVHSGNAVYFDVLGYGLISWPADWTLPWAVAVLALAVLNFWGSVLGNRRQSHGKTQWLPEAMGAMLGLLGGWLLLAAALWSLGQLLEMDTSLQTPWPHAAFSLLLCYWLAGLAMTCAIARMVGERVGSGAWVAAMGLIWSAIALWLTWQWVGASYLFLVPATILVVGAGIASVSRRPAWAVLAVVATGWVVGLMWLPNEALFYDALGFRYPLAIAIRIVPVVTIGLPLLAGQSGQRVWTLAACLLLGMVGCAAFGIIQNRIIG